MQEKKLGQNVNLSDLEIIDSTTDTKDAMKQLEQLKIFRICLHFAMVILIFFFCLFCFFFSFFFVFIPTNIWITGKNLMKLQYRQKKLFTAN